MSRVWLSMCVHVHSSRSLVNEWVVQIFITNKINVSLRYHATKQPHRFIFNCDVFGRRSCITAYIEHVLWYVSGWKVSDQLRRSNVVVHEVGTTGSTIQIHQIHQRGSGGSDRSNQTVQCNISSVSNAPIFHRYLGFTPALSIDIFAYSLCMYRLYIVVHFCQQRDYCTHRLSSPLIFFLSSSISYHPNFVVVAVLCGVMWYGGYTLTHKLIVFQAGTSDCIILNSTHTGFTLQKRIKLSLVESCAATGAVVVWF